MQYRKFGRLDWQVSALGFGLERLPPDEVKTVKMLRLAIDSGINYLDIGWPFAQKNHERVSRALYEALSKGYREKIRIAATIPSIKIQTASDFDRHLEDLLQWLRADSLDFLLLGGLNRFTWPPLQEMNLLSHAEAAMVSKKIDYIGFFFHDQYQFLRDILEAYDNWSLAGFQYSFMDVDHHPGVSGLQLAASRGLGAVASGALLGGRLTKKIPDSVAAIWSGAKPRRTPAAWALRWVWNHPEVSTVVSDMSTLEQVKENAALADVAPADSFTVPEELVISRVRDAYRALKPIPCTACRGCMPCPQNIDVPRIFEIFNDAAMYGDIETAKSIYRLEKHCLEDCNECGACVSACGKQIPITDWLEKARAILTEND
jgi:predicted aldo/keto reductase-like oxidoreductase